MIHELLIIEDNDITRKLLKESLERADKTLNLTAVGSFREAIAKINKNSYEVIVADHYVGDHDGFDVLKIAGNIPVVFVTGHDEVSVAVKAMKLGAYDFILKDEKNDFLTILPLVIKKAIQSNTHQQLLKTTEFRYKN